MALKMTRAAIAKAIPTSAQTIQDGKYEPRMLREGAPLQPLSKLSIETPHHVRAAGKKPLNALRLGDPLSIFMMAVSSVYPLPAAPPLGERVRMGVVR
jgi:hypothetical protein